MKMNWLRFAIHFDLLFPATAVFVFIIVVLLRIFDAI